MERGTNEILEDLRGIGRRGDYEASLMDELEAARQREAAQLGVEATPEITLVEPKLNVVPPEQAI